MKIGSKFRYCSDGTLSRIPTPVFGYKSRISIDRRFGFIGKAVVTSIADSAGGQMRRMIDTANTVGDVWANSAYRTSKNQARLKAHMLNGRMRRHKPNGKPMPEQIACANAEQAVIRACSERVHAIRKTAMASSSASSALQVHGPSSRLPIWPPTSTA